MKKTLMTAAMISSLAIGGQLADAAVVGTTTHSGGSLDGQIVIGDLLSGLIGSDDGLGWHGANPFAGDTPAALATFTNDAGNNGLQALAIDAPGAGVPNKTVNYDLGGAFDIEKINIFSAWGDARVASTAVVSFSTNGGGSFSQIGYFQSDPSGFSFLPVNTINATLVEITDDQGGLLGSGVTDITFELYAAGTGPDAADPFDGTNPFTGTDDGIAASSIASALSEIDVIGTPTIPEPASAALLGLGGLALLLRRRK